MGYVDFSDLAQVPTLKKDGYNVWGYPEFGFEYIVYNFKDKTGDFDKIIGQLYIRQALAHLQDEPALLKSRASLITRVARRMPRCPMYRRRPLRPLTPR